MPALFQSFAIAPHGDDFILRIATSDGAAHEVIATFAQLDQLAEEIDRQLDDNEGPDLSSGPFIGANDSD